MRPAALLLPLLLLAPAAVAHGDQDGAFIITVGGERCYLLVHGPYPTFHRESNGNGPGSHDDTEEANIPEGVWVAWFVDARTRHYAGLALPLETVWARDSGMQESDQHYGDQVTWARDCGLVP